MNESMLFRLDVLAVLVIGIVAWIALVRSRSVSVKASERALAEARRFTVAATPAAEAAPEIPLGRRVMRLLAAWGKKLPLFNAKQQGEISRQLIAAGLRQIYALQAFVAIKVMCGAVGVSLVSVALGREWIAPQSAMVSMILMVGGFLVGMLAPELVLKSLVRRRQKQIHRSLSDALDLMVICTNAGYSLSATLRCVATELKTISPAIADELEFTFQETQIQSDTIAALRNLAERTGVESLRALSATLIQSHRYGTPITQSLKVLAKSERTARMLRLEEQGAKLAVKITIPMMLLILPAVMLLLGGPAFMHVSEALTR